MSILQLYSSNNYMVINRDFAEKHGLNNAVIFGNLCSMATQHDNYFYFTIEDLAISTTLCKDTVKKGIAYLSKSGYIKKTRKGIPAKNWYSINEELLESEVSTNKMGEKSTNWNGEKSTNYNTSNSNSNTSNKQSVDLSMIKSDEVKEAILDFIAYRKERRQPYTQKSIERLLKQFSGYPDSILIEAINESIVNGWQGVFMPKGVIKEEPKKTDYMKGIKEV